MSVVDKILGKLSIGEEDQDEYEYDEEYDNDDDNDYNVGEEGKKAMDMEERSRKSNTRISSMKQSKRTPVPAANGSGVYHFKPTSFEEGRVVTDILLDNLSIVLNLEGLDIMVAQRIIDYASGACSALKGNLQKISGYIFIITPANVSITGNLPEVGGASTGGIDVPMMNEY